MSKTLAELRQSPKVGLPERTYSMCLASSLVGEVRALVEGLQEAEAIAAAQSGDDATKTRPRRAAEASPTLRIRGRLRELREEMAEHTGVLTLRGINDGKWREWVDAHPARKESERDRHVAFGYCNADDLIEDLGSYAATWNDEPIKPADWEFIKANAAPGDLKELVQLVVSMHELAVDVPKLLSDLLATVDAETG